MEISVKVRKAFTQEEKIAMRAFGKEHGYVEYIERPTWTRTYFINESESPYPDSKAFILTNSEDDQKTYGVYDTVFLENENFLDQEYARTIEYDARRAGLEVI